MTWYQHIVQFYKQLKPPSGLPEGVETLYPFDNADTFHTFDRFYKKYYDDERKRRCIVGINPGRFGGGITGIPFTDPIRLEAACDIKNDYQKRQELSSVYMYDMIDAYGGATAFYNAFYITSYSPLGFVKNGKNLNYYDEKPLAAAIEPFAVKSFREQLSWDVDQSVAFCLGDGKNFLHLNKLNKKYGFFQAIIPLSHPRFIMQYKLKQKEVYIQRYLDAFHQ